MAESFEEQSKRMETDDYKRELRERRDAWYVESRKQNMRTLPAFLAKLAESPHDYNSIVYAVAAAALAAACAIDGSPNGGITGFQAGAVAWEFWGKWLHEEGPARMLRYENALFPQYENTFRAISAETWAWMQEEAKKRLADKESAHPEVRAHWQSIADGTPPFGLLVEQ